MSTQSLPPLPLKCYELLALLADAKKPVREEDIPKPLAGNPLTVCKGRGCVEFSTPTSNADIQLLSYLKGSYRYYDHETEREFGTVFLNHIRLTKEGHTCLAEYRLRCEPQSARANRRCSLSR